MDLVKERFVQHFNVCAGIIWDLEDKDLSECCYSKTFTLEEDLEFYFELYPKKEGFVGLSLRQLRGIELKTLELYIARRYKDKWKYSTYENLNLKSRKNDQNAACVDRFYDLVTIKSRGLSEMHCFVIKNLKKFCETEDDEDEQSEDESSEDKSSEDESDKEDNNNECPHCSSKIKYGDGTVGMKISEPAKLKGEIALVENLKTAFLNDEDSDVILKVGDRKYPAHKVIVRSRSSVFHAMLKHDMIEKEEGIVVIPDCDPLIFRDFLQYLYTGKVDNVTTDNVFELYHMSDKYDVKELRMDCIEFIINNLTVETICEALFLATKHCERTLLTQATTLFISNVKDILTTVKWQNFAKDNPIEANELFIKCITKD